MSAQMNLRCTCGEMQGIARDVDRRRVRLACYCRDCQCGCVVSRAPGAARSPRRNRGRAAGALAGDVSRRSGSARVHAAELERADALVRELLQDAAGQHAEQAQDAIRGLAVELLGSHARCGGARPIARTAARSRQRSRSRGGRRQHGRHRSRAAGCDRQLDPSDPRLGSFAASISRRRSSNPTLQRSSRACSRSPSARRCWPDYRFNYRAGEGHASRSPPSRYTRLASDSPVESLSIVRCTLASGSTTGSRPSAKLCSRTITR